MMQHEFNCFINPINRDPYRFLALILMPKLCLLLRGELPNEPRLSKAGA